MANDCKTRFSVRLYNGVRAIGVYDHMTGNLDIGPDAACEAGVEPSVWRAAVELCQELDGNYFHIRDVKIALRDANTNFDDLNF